MFKKIMSLCLIVTMFLGSMISISAYSDEELDTRPPTSQELSNSAISGDFELALPNENFVDQSGNVVCVRAYSAYREPNGDVTLYVDSFLNSKTSFYRFFATDSNGNFEPNNDLSFSVDEILYGHLAVHLPASSVSKDGYVYFSFAMVLDQGEPYINKNKFKVPVDYDKYKVTSEDFMTIEPSQNYTITGMAGQYLEYNATATRRSNGNVLLQLNVINKNVNAVLEHFSTDLDSVIFLHNHVTTHTISNNAVNISLYKTTIAKSGYVYFTIYFTATNGSRYAVEQIKIPIQA